MFHNSLVLTSERNHELTTEHCTSKLSQDNHIEVYNTSPIEEIQPMERSTVSLKVLKWNRVDKQ